MMRVHGGPDAARGDRSERPLPGGAPRLRLLVSARDVGEAMLAAAAGVDYVDLKESRDGALGAVAPHDVRAIVRALRAAGHRMPISATIGDVAMHRQGEVLARVAAVGACAVDYVKVGIEPHAQAPALLRALAGCGHAVVPVLLVDRGLDEDLLAAASAGRPPVLMLDTVDKRGGSLLDRIEPQALRHFVDRTRRAGALAGLAGSLRLEQLAALQSFEPDLVGFRGAVCAGDRAAPLDPARLRALVAERDRRHAGATTA